MATSLRRSNGCRSTVVMSGSRVTNRYRALSGRLCVSGSPVAKKAHLIPRLQLGRDMADERARGKTAGYVIIP